MFLLTFGVVATACGAAAWPAWLDREVDLLGEAPLEEGRDLRPLGRKAAMLWLAPSAKMNFSRSSTFVLPLAAAKKGVNFSQDMKIVTRLFIVIFAMPTPTDFKNK